MSVKNILRAIFAKVCIRNAEMLRTKILTTIAAIMLCV